MTTGILHESFAVALYPGIITIQNLLARTRYLVKASLNTTLGSTDFSEAMAFTTEDPSQPGQLAQMSVVNIGPSSLQVQWAGPKTTGGGVISGKLHILSVASVCTDLTMLSSLCRVFDIPARY